MSNISDDPQFSEIVVYDMMEMLIDQSYQILQQKEEEIKIKDLSIQYALKQCEYFISLQLIFHDQENGQYKITDEDQEPSNMRNDNMQCYSIQKRKRILSSQDELSQNSIQNNENGLNDSQLTAQQLMNAMNNKQGYGIFLTPIKDRSYVRSLIAKEKLNNMSYQEILNNSITYYGKDNLDIKATNLFNKYVKGHSLGPLRIDQQISPLRVQPKELALPKNVAFQRCFPQDIVEQLEEKVVIENLDIDVRKISLDISQLDYSKIKLPSTQKKDIESSLLHVPTYQSIFQQNSIKQDNSKLTLPTQNINTQQMSVQSNNVSQYMNNNRISPLKKKPEETYSYSRTQQTLAQDQYEMPQSFRQQITNTYNNAQQQVKVGRALSTNKSNNQSINKYGIENNDQPIRNNKLRNIGKSQERNIEPPTEKSPPQLRPIINDQKYLRNYFSQNDRSIENLQRDSLNLSSIQIHQQSNDINESQQDQLLLDDDANESSIYQSKMENYKKQKVMRKELSQLLLERKKQQNYKTQVKNNNDKNKITLFAPERYTHIRNRSQASPIPSKINSSFQMKDVLNISLNTSGNNNLDFYQPQIQQKVNYNTNHIKTNYLPSLKTQRLNYNK